MKNLRFNLLKKADLVMAVTSSILFTACSKDDDEEMSGSQTITQVVVSNNSFSLLEAALIHAGLTDVLSGKGPFTVFAPNNEAFVAAGLDT